MHCRYLLVHIQEEDDKHNKPHLNGLCQCNCRLVILVCFCTPASMVWVCAETSGQTPQARCDHGSALVGRRMAVFGGSAGENKWLNDLHFLDLGECGRDLYWNPVEPEPLPFFLSFIHYSPHSPFLPPFILPTCFILDSMVWTGFGEVEMAPSPRDYPVLVPVSDKVCIQCIHQVLLVRMYVLDLDILYSGTLWHCIQWNLFSG